MNGCKIPSLKSLRTCSYPLANLCEVLPRQNLEVLCKGARLQDLRVSLILERSAEQDVASQSGVSYPCLLGHVRQPSLQWTDSLIRHTQRKYGHIHK